MVKTSCLVLIPLFLSRLAQSRSTFPLSPSIRAQVPFEMTFSPTDDRSYTKSIAIVGAGSAGLAALKTLFDLPHEVRASWEVVLYEQKHTVGGLWLPDPNEPHPPDLPETPLYPRLKANTPHPTMTYPGFPFPPGTPLFPQHEYIEQYHVDYVKAYNLSQYIKLNHTVLAAGWRGNQHTGKWEVEVEGEDKKVVLKEFDHLVVANGHNHYPRIPQFVGQEDWLANSPAGGPKREILHSMFYREPERYRNRTLVVVGGGASGRDAALQVAPLTKVYQSLKSGSSPPDGANVTVRPPISHFTKDGVVFEDGTSANDVDSLLLATGYEFRVPFLSRTPSHWPSESYPDLLTQEDIDVNSTTAPKLVSNLRYIFPLYEHLFSLSPTYPSTALAFIGLPILIANCPSDIAQALFVAHAIANPSLLPPRDKMLSSLVERENRLRGLGFDPYYVGHKMLGGDAEAQTYQNSLVAYLKKHGALPNDGEEYVEWWRKLGRTEARLLARAWTRVEAMGQEEVKKWVGDVEGEDEWAELMVRLQKWQEKWEKEGGETIDLYGIDIYDAMYDL